MVRSQVVDLLRVDEQEQVLADELDHVKVRSEWRAGERESEVSFRLESLQLAEGSLLGDVASNCVADAL